MNAIIRPFESFRVGERADKQLIRVPCTTRGRDSAVVIKGESTVKRLRETPA